MKKNDEFNKLLHDALSKASEDQKKKEPYKGIFEMFKGFVSVGFDPDQALYMTAEIVKSIAMKGE